MMVLSEMVRSRSSSFKRSFKKKASPENSDVCLSNSNCSCSMKRPVSGGEWRVSNAHRNKFTKSDILNARKLTPSCNPTKILYFYI